MINGAGIGDFTNARSRAVSVLLKNYTSKGFFCPVIRKVVQLTLILMEKKSGRVVRMLALRFRFEPHNGRFFKYQPSGDDLYMRTCLRTSVWSKPSMKTGWWQCSGSVVLVVAGSHKNLEREFKTWISFWSSQSVSFYAEAITKTCSE